MKYTLSRISCQSGICLFHFVVLQNSIVQCGQDLGPRKLIYAENWVINLSISIDMQCCIIEINVYSNELFLFFVVA